MRAIPLAIALLFAAPASAQPFAPSADDRLVAEGRAMIAREHPDLMRHIARNDGFGGPSSPLIARDMLSASPDRVEAARTAMKIERYGRQMWLLRFPYVNVALIETLHGVVVFDTGYAAIGPVLADYIPKLTPKPVTHIVVSHVHVDHAYGWTALKARWPRAKTITSALFPAMAAKEVRLGGSIGRLNNQPLGSWPASVDRLPRPDIVFPDRLTLTIDGERFDFRRDPAETEEQIWLSLPERKAIVTADYYQGFLPNAGNGKRIMRHVDEWADAFRAMAALRPRYLLPMHSAAVEGEDEVARRLGVYAGALEHVSTQVVARLNAGERKDAIAASIDWPERFANERLLDPQYNRPADIARMVALRWTGWWDDIPSHFAALPFEAEAREAVRLAGGIEGLDKRAREILATEPKLAARLADWALYGAPDDPRALRLAIDVYLARLAEPDMPVQEGTIYLDVAARARARLAVLEAKGAGK